MMKTFLDDLGAVRSEYWYSYLNLFKFSMYRCAPLLLLVGHILNEHPQWLHVQFLAIILTRRYQILGTSSFFVIFSLHYQNVYMNYSIIVICLWHIETKLGRNVLQMVLIKVLMLMGKFGLAARFKIVFRLAEVLRNLVFSEI